MCKHRLVSCQHREALCKHQGVATAPRRCCSTLKSDTLVLPQHPRFYSVCGGLGRLAQAQLKCGTVGKYVQGRLRKPGEATEAPREATVMSREANTETPTPLSRFPLLLTQRLQNRRTALLIQPPLVCVALLECDVAAVQSVTSLTPAPQCILLLIIVANYYYTLAHR